MIVSADAEFGPELTEENTGLSPTEPGVYEGHYMYQHGPGNENTTRAWNFTISEPNWDNTWSRTAETFDTVNFIAYL